MINDVLSAVRVLGSHVNAVILFQGNMCGGTGVVEMLDYL